MQNITFVSLNFCFCVPFCPLRSLCSNPFRLFRFRSDSFNSVPFRFDSLRYVFLRSDQIPSDPFCYDPNRLSTFCFLRSNQIPFDPFCSVPFSVFRLFRFRFDPFYFESFCFDPFFFIFPPLRSVPVPHFLFRSVPQFLSVGLGSDSICLKLDKCC